MRLNVLADAARRDASLVTVPRPEPSRRFVPIPLRWRAEQGLGILTTRNRRLVRDREQLPDASETMLPVANPRRPIRPIARPSQGQIGSEPDHGAGELDR